MAITPVQDRTFNRQVEARIASRGLASPCRISVATVKGEVTLTGTVQYAGQKPTAVQAATAVTGVRRVVDRLTIKTIAKF